MMCPKRPSLLLPHIDAMDAGVITFLCAVRWRRRAALCCGLGSAKLLPSRLSRSQAEEAGGCCGRSRDETGQSLARLTSIPNTQGGFPGKRMEAKPQGRCQSKLWGEQPCSACHPLRPTAAGMQGAGINASARGWARFLLF